METRNCQNCKQDFNIEPDDFSFYEKIKVPPPTFCPECRMIRRMVWRNERSLYKRRCDLCQDNIIAMYPEGSIFPVYCRECWWSDKWDAATFGQEYDYSKTFFSQFKELQNKVPRLALFQRNVTNSDYANMIGECKNVYLSVSVVLGSENIFYSKGVDASSNIFDSYNVVDCDRCYEVVEGEKNYNSQYLILSRNCIDSYFLFDCVNCTNCILCTNLRNKEFCVRNIQYSKEGYVKELENLNLGSRSSRKEVINEFKSLQQNATHRFANIFRSVDSTGNNLSNVNNLKNCFDVHDSENGKNCYRAFFFKDNMDADYCGKSELMYEYSTGAKDDYNVKFSYSAMDNVRNAEYTDSCVSCSNIFGCIGLRKGEYAVLNKSYSKEEFIKLRENIIAQMNTVPYHDKVGREYKYGEFFPIELSVLAYNETGAYDLIPLTKEEAEKEGYPWKDQEVKDFNITLHSDDIPDNISEVNDEILKEVLGCADKSTCTHRCMTAFKLTQDEFQFYKKNSIPLPIKCSNCRHYERFGRIPPAKLWHRSCMCNQKGHFHSENPCSNEFETSYTPNRLEKVYCEQCYQQEVL